jgi:hypothetical protein
MTPDGGLAAGVTARRHGRRVEQLYEGLEALMSAVPRIRRAVVDEADVYRPAQGIPVVASMEYPASGTREDVEAVAIAWTRECVEVVWSWRGEQQADWIEAHCVKRR